MTLNGIRLKRAARIRIRMGSGERFSILYVVCLVAFLLLVLGSYSQAISEHPVEILVCLTTGGLSVYGQLLSLKREASINFVSFVFCFLFMSVAPIGQIGARADSIFEIGNWALLAAINGLLFTIIGVYLTKRMKFPDQVVQVTTFVPARHNYVLLFLLSVVTSGTAILLFHDSLFTSREEFSRAAGEVFQDPIVSLMARMLLLSTPFFATMFGLRAAIENRHKVWIVLFALSMVLVAVVDNPVAHARYQLAGLVFFAVDYYFYGRRTKFLAVMLIVGVLIAPALQVFRYERASDASQGGGLFDSTLLSKDYDAFQMSSYTILTVDRAGIGWGSNILGATLFFVPRALWTSKPEPTAWIVYETANHSTDLGTTNLSTPLMAEGYFAFGWPGALLIAFLYWWAIARVTQLSWKDANSWAFLSRCLLVGLVLIFLRGTLTVGVSAVAGYFVAAAIPALFLRLGAARRRSRRRSLGSFTNTAAVRKNSRIL